jgi:ABC-type multidrug transport system permease subunit
VTTEPRPPLVELTIVRVKEFLREPEALFWVFAFPLLLALALGFAFRDRAPDRVPIAVAAGEGAEPLARALADSPGVSVRILESDRAEQELRAGKVSMLVRPGNPVVCRMDPTRPDARQGRLEVDAAVRRLGGQARDLVAIDTVHEPGRRYIDFLIPGLLGLNLMGTGIWGVGFSIVNARLKKLLKLLVASPMRKSDFLLSQILGRLVFLVFEASALLLFGWLVFRVPVLGSPLLLAGTALVGAMTFSGLGLLVASRAQTMETATGWMNAVMLPMWLLSGTFFSSERFPAATQPFLRLLPLTALNDALRRIMGGATSLSAVAVELAVLVAWGAVSFAAALRIFRWQ